MNSCLIIGAGMAGLTAGRLLAEKGIDVRVLDKGRAVGGRLATRRIESPKGNGVFDYGAQFMTVSDPLLEEWVLKWNKEGYVEPWPSATEQNGPRTRWIGKNGMRTIAKLLAENLSVHTGVHIIKVEYQNEQWWVYDKTGLSFHADTLVLTAPVPQALDLLQTSQYSLPEHEKNELEKIIYEPCFALLIMMEQSTEKLALGPIEFDHGSIRWIADNKQKGISPQRIAVTLHASPEFTRHHFDKDHKWVIDHMIDAAVSFIGKINVIDTVQLHRWRFSLVTKPFTKPFYSIATPGPLVMAGDGFNGARIESAFLSGKAGAEHLLNYFR